MYFKVNKNSLHEHLLKILKVTPTRTTTPILSCVYLSLEGNKLCLKGADVDIVMNLSMDVSGMEDGNIAIPARLFAELIGELESGIISLKADYEGVVTVLTNRGKYEIMGRPGEEFPAVPNVNILYEFEIDGGLLSRIIKKTIFAVARDEIKPALMGVLFQFKNGEMRAVSTDGHKLVCLKRYDIDPGDFNGEVIVPTKFLNVVQTYLREGSKVRVGIGSEHIVLTMDSMVVYSMLINERFPDYESVIPQENDKVLEAEVETFLSVLKRVSICSSKATHQIVLNLEPEGMLKMKAFDEENRNSGEEEFDGSFSGDVFSISFNSEFLKELIRNVDSGKFTFEFKTQTSPALLKPLENVDNEEMIMLVMPIRMAEE